MNDKAEHFPIMTGADSTPRLSMVIWGLYNVGKTTFAATAPGVKLWVSFGDNEHVTVMHRKDVRFMNMAHKSPEFVFRHGVGPSPFGLDRTLSEDKSIKTVVIDSLTVVEQLGLEKAVLDGVGKSRDFSPTMQIPGRAAYGGRNQNLLAFVKAILQVTGKHGVHVIFTGHENDPITRSDGRGNDTLEVINMALTSKLLNTVSSSLSEVWNLRLEPGGKRNRIITTRVSGYRRPMKTRMFDQKGEASFILQYDPDRPDTDKDQMTLARFYEQWVKGGMRRIPIPANRRGGDAGDNNPQPTKGGV